MLHFIEVGQEVEARKIAVFVQEGVQSGIVSPETCSSVRPDIFWFGGLNSDMNATKAQALGLWALEHGFRFIRFDYSGHGQSSGPFEAGSISAWLEDAHAVVKHFGSGAHVLVGSSMGAWIALLLARLLKQTSDFSLTGMIFIAPACDFTQALMWDRLDDAAREQINLDGYYLRPSLYSATPYKITQNLIEDGKKHLLLKGMIEVDCPVHIFQGMLDEDVPWQHSLKLVEHLQGDNVCLTLIKDGDHRLSRAQDIELLKTGLMPFF